MDRFLIVAAVLATPLALAQTDSQTVSPPPPQGQAPPPVVPRLDPAIVPIEPATPSMEPAVPSMEPPRLKLDPDLDSFAPLALPPPLTSTPPPNEEIPGESGD